MSAFTRRPTGRAAGQETAESVNLFNALCISFLFKCPRATKGRAAGGGTAPEENGHYEFRLQGAIITREYFMAHK